MLPESLIATFDRLWKVETEKLDEQVQAGIMSAISECAQRGMLHSSGACLMVVAAASNERLRGELELTVAATSLRQNQANGQSSGTAPTMVFNAPVGVLQTGPGSYGVAHQQIDQGTSENLRRALEMLVKQLPTSQEDLPFDPSEVRDMIEASTTELDAPKPNALKLRSLLSGIGGVILNAPRLKDAYDTLKWAAKFVGVDLP